jgi:hypothetical protein
MTSYLRQFGTLLKMSAVAVPDDGSLEFTISCVSSLSICHLYTHDKVHDIVRDLDCSRAYGRTNKIGAVLRPNTKADDK